MLCAVAIFRLDTLKAKDGYEVADPAVKEREEHPLPEDFEVEVHVLLTGLVK